MSGRPGGAPGRLPATVARRCPASGAIAATVLLLILSACGKRVWSPSIHAPDRPPATERDTYLKVHLRSGDVVVLRTWSFRDSALIRGEGSRYGPDRQSGPTTPRGHAIPLDSVALFEASHRDAIRPWGLSLLGVTTTVWGLATGVCVADPKVCFGSCPTFYAFDGRGERLMAEGFSGSVARVLEAADLDALPHAVTRGSRFEVTVRNEALETHAIRRVRLHAAVRPEGGLVFAGPDGLLRSAGAVVSPSSCRAREGDCREAVARLDGLERRSVTDSADLGAREVVELSFPPVRGPTGLVIGARHSFVSTFLLYQTLAYMGRESAAWLARLERGDPLLLGRMRMLFGTLGRMRVSVAGPDGVWREAGAYGEHGPIAADVQVVPLPPLEGTVRVRLEMARGYWRVDQAALVRLDGPARARALVPRRVHGPKEDDPAALAALLDDARYLVTLPGDEYRLDFELPNGGVDVALFLESEGHYYEWMREEWLEEEDPAMIALALGDPDRYLRHLAPLFKRLEPLMERAFWQSRFGR